MATEVLLMSDVSGLGSEGDVVTVADGYARNFLLPRKLGAPVSEATRRQLAKVREVRQQEKADAVAVARSAAERLSDASCTIAVRVGEEERLYGSVTAGDIANALQGQGIEIDRHTIDMEHPIKELGVFDVPVRLHPEVEATVRVWVVEE